MNTGIVLLTILGMIAFYGLIGYFLIGYVARKIWRNSLDRYQIIQILLVLSIVFVIVQAIRYQSWTLALPITGILVPMINMMTTYRRKQAKKNMEEA